jgi:hypothetical protein
MFALKPLSFLVVFANRKRRRKSGQLCNLLVHLLQVPVFRFRQMVVEVDKREENGRHEQQQVRLTVSHQVSQGQVDG